MSIFPPHSPLLWPQYELLDFGKGFRLERWGERVLARPDADAFGQPGLSSDVWDSAEFFFEERFGKPGRWLGLDGTPVADQAWNVELQPYKRLELELRLSPFKHLGAFPEQYSQWKWLGQKIAQEASRRTEPPRVLNLFAYTGVASLVAAQAGATVTHIEASKSTITWGRHNQQLSGLSEASIRWIPEDVMTFVEREQKRGNKYDAILLDPPAYGVAPGGKRWQFDRSIWQLLASCRDLLSDDAAFLLLNAYAGKISARRWSLQMAELMEQYSGEIVIEPLSLECAARKQPLTTGLAVLWSQTLGEL